MNIQTIRNRVSEGNYLTKPHAVQHALKEGFERKHIVEAILSGDIIEEYFDAQRVLICGQAFLDKSLKFICMLYVNTADPIYIEFVTAYIPDETQWVPPTFRHRRREKR